MADVAMEIQETAQEPKPEYVFPPIELLKRPKQGKQGDSDDTLRRTAQKLQQTLHNFGVGGDSQQCELRPHGNPL